MVKENELDIFPDKEKIKSLNKEAGEIIEKIRKELKKFKIRANFFIGGSLAKKTLVKREDYDIDIFVRFLRENDIDKLEKASHEAFGKNAVKIHGSRDYFQIKKEGVIFEIIPVLKISNPKKAENVTDLSYFHVNYVKKEARINKGIEKEIILAKAFCKSAGVYGAESYIRGFSGYALECLIIYYKSLKKMLFFLSKEKNKIIIDPKKHYKNREEIKREMNESKSTGPVILVDPTFKERNVCAALSFESFKKFQEAGRNYLKSPSKSFFLSKEFNPNKLKTTSERWGGELTKVIIKTDRQKGDIAGTKLKKFSEFIKDELEKRFIVNKFYFIYDEKNSADAYYLTKNKEILFNGPPISMKKHALIFKKMHRNAFMKKGRLWAEMPEIKPKAYLKQRIINKMARKMDISKFEIKIV